MARGRVHSYDDPRAASRATIGIALGCVAILLGITGAYFLPRVMDRADRFLSTIQQDVNQNVDLVNNGLSRDVDRLDRTLTRDLSRFERDNHRDVTDLENRTAATLKQLEDRMQRDVDDVAQLGEDATSRRSRPRCAGICMPRRQDMRTADSDVARLVAALEARDRAHREEARPVTGAGIGTG